MNIENYFKDLSDELEALKNRVRNYIDKSHSLSDGEWKESVLRTVLKRHLPRNIGIGRGFIVKPEQSSTQIDILLYDNTKPILFQDGDFVIVTPDSVKGVIEVKTTGLHNVTQLRKAVNGISNIAEFVNPFSVYDKNRFYGLFSYEEPAFAKDKKPVFIINKMLGKIQECVGGHPQRVVNLASFGKDYFVRYWPCLPNSASPQGYYMWHAYHIENKAPAYFIRNVIDHLYPEWTSQNNDVWYPETGMENHKVAEKFLYLPNQIT